MPDLDVRPTHVTEEMIRSLRDQARPHAANPLYTLEYNNAISREGFIERRFDRGTIGEVERLYGLFEIWVAFACKVGYTPAL